jgi:hypothetical protein
MTRLSPILLCPVEHYHTYIYFPFNINQEEQLIRLTLGGILSRGARTIRTSRDSEGEVCLTHQVLHMVYQSCQVIDHKARSHMHDG